MKHTSTPVVLLGTSLLLGSLSTVFAADAERGRKLHDAQCMKCHDTSVYTRSDHFVLNRNALDKQVTRCHQNVGAEWSDEDVADVVQYLDETFYHFGAKD